MTFEGFTQTDFDVFTVPGLEARMEGIQSRIQPKFKAIGERLVHEAALLSGTEMFLHIAKHARRTVNAPVDTWMAVCHNKRGYKQYPHFQVGLFEDRVFIWLALIYELPNKQLIAQRFFEPPAGMEKPAAGAIYAFVRSYEEGCRNASRDDGG
ncbi:DUF1054 family protein [Paenibacillus sp. TAB 01]|uniref:DUF1054 family protein n=1 Tax=Paenibacillus sp. TAB 01 TaxID=3368988 RepID=UPI0037526FB5